MMRKAIICDLDGTLFICGDRGPYEHDLCTEDSVNHAVASVVRAFHPLCHILLVSGREEKFITKTMWALAFQKIPYAHLWMRVTGDKRSDEVVKRELYEQHIQSQYNVIFVLDDRNRVVKMWREIGLSCFQVADGDF